jgi:hypothetical protein
VVDFEIQFEVAYQFEKRAFDRISARNLEIIQKTIESGSSHRLKPATRATYTLQPTCHLDCVNCVPPTKPSSNDPRPGNKYANLVSLKCSRPRSTTLSRRTVGSSNLATKLPSERVEEKVSQLLHDFSQWPVKLNPSPLPLDRLFTDRFDSLGPRNDDFKRSI